MRIGVSSNQFDKLSLTSGSNSFSKLLSVGTNSFTKLILSLGNNSWEGENLGGEGFDAMAEAWGSGKEFGGISHFQSRADYTVTH